MEPIIDERKDKNKRSNAVRSSRATVTHLDDIVCKKTLSIANNSGEESS
jgi:hypothetical protein